MWIKGLIYGFLSREDSDRLLQTQAAIPGSFLVRFSDRCAGQFVVVYVSQGKKVSSYLLSLLFPMFNIYFFFFLFFLGGP